jgi:hypothetical protein
MVMAISIHLTDMPLDEDCQNYTSTAHSPQRTVKTLTQVEAKVEDGDYETRREDGDLPFPNSNPCVIIGH